MRPIWVFLSVCLCNKGLGRVLASIANKETLSHSAADAAQQMMHNLVWMRLNGFVFILVLVFFFLSFSLDGVSNGR